MYLIMLVPDCIIPVYSGDSLLSSWIKFPFLKKKKKKKLALVTESISLKAPEFSLPNVCELHKTYYC